MTAAESASTQGHWVPDFVAGLTTGVANIPDAMASAILAGANPVQGLYAIMVGTPLGAVFGSSAFMSVSATSAMAITAGMALEGYSADDHFAGVATLAVMTGVVMIVAGLLNLGRLLRFVSNSVVVGFLTGVSITVVLSQLGDLTGYESPYSNNVAKTVDLLLNLNEINPHTTIIGLLTIVVILAVGRTRLANFNMLAGMIVGTVAVLLLSWTDVQQVQDIAEIPSSLPRPLLPRLDLVFPLLAPALSLSIIGLVQGSGVSKSYPNPDGDYPDLSRDFIGQGAANVGAGLFRGMPIGGSVSSTALNISAGAQTRWANIMSGLVVVLAILLFSRAVSLVAMPAMAGLLVVAGAQSLKWTSVQDVWQTGASPRVVFAVTLALSLIVPLQYAVLGGVLLSMLAYVLSSSKEVTVLQVVESSGGEADEVPPPATLPSDQTTMLSIYGNLFFAGADAVESQLPDVGGAVRPVLILNLRSQTSISSTFLTVIERYSEQLRAAGGKLMLSAVHEDIMRQLRDTGTIEDTLGAENVFPAEYTLDASSVDAYHAAESWLAAGSSEPEP